MTRIVPSGIRDVLLHSRVCAGLSRKASLASDDFGSVAVGQSSRLAVWH